MLNTQDQNMVVVPAIQLTLRKALLHKAGPEVKNKFTGNGLGENVILSEDAECIVATIMAVMKAVRNNSEIVIDDAKYRVCEYPVIGAGLAKCINWNGKSYYSEVDNERPERSFVVTELPDYVQDSTKVQGKVRKAEGKVVSPVKFEQLITSFNNINAKSGDDARIQIGSKIDKNFIKFGDFNYLYVDGDVRRVAEGSDKYGLEFVTFMQPRVKFNGLVFGSISEEAPELTVLEWLI